MSTYPYNQFLEPTSPLHSATPWELEVGSNNQNQNQNQQDLFLQDQQIPQRYEPHPIIQLEEQPLPDIQRHDHLFSAQRASEGRSEDQCLHDATRHSTSPYAGSSSMPIRRPPTRPRTQLATHPYRRPQSAAPASGRSTTTRAAAASSSKAQHQQVRFADDTQPCRPPSIVIPSGSRVQQNSASARLSSSSSPRCAMTTTDFVSEFPIPRCKFSHILRNTPPTAVATASTRQDPAERGSPPSEKPEPRRFIIRSDVYFDAESKVLSAVL
jgi:hypothetical protein